MKAPESFVQIGDCPILPSAADAPLLRALSHRRPSSGFSATPRCQAASRARAETSDCTVTHSLASCPPACTRSTAWPSASHQVQQQRRRRRRRVCMVLSSTRSSARRSEGWTPTHWMQLSTLRPSPTTGTQDVQPSGLLFHTLLAAAPTLTLRRESGRVCALQKPCTGRGGHPEGHG